MASEDVDQLKKKRSYAKANVTKAINRINEMMQRNEAVDIVKEDIGKLRSKFKDFQESHEIIHSQLTAENEMADSNEYYRDCLESVSIVEGAFQRWIKEHDVRAKPEVRVNDNVSLISSRSSN